MEFQKNFQDKFKFKSLCIEIIPKSIDDNLIKVICPYITLLIAISQGNFSIIKPFFTHQFQKIPAMSTYKIVRNDRPSYALRLYYN